MSRPVRLDVCPGGCSEGKRLLLLQFTGIEEGQAQVNVVINWVEELKRLVPAD